MLSFYEIYERRDMDELKEWQKIEKPLQEDSYGNELFERFLANIERGKLEPNPQQQ